MPGMNMGGKLSTTNPTVVSAFHSALLRQGLVVLAILALAFLAWNFVRIAAFRAARDEAAGGDRPGAGVAFAAVGAEAPARRLLRISFGLLWILDGLLQLQASMPLGLVPGTIDPAASGSPAWVRHLVHAGTTIWNDHPVTAATAVVWVQLGIGLFLVLAPRGRWSRFAGATSVAWGLLVWVFGESFGGIFAPSPSLLFGAPGAVVFYCAAGLLVALPERYFETQRLGRVIVSVLGAFFVLMAAVQAWPSNGFWRQGHGGVLASMGYTMATTPQPHPVSVAVRAFAAFDAGHAVATNAVVVIALAAVGLLFLAGRRRSTEAGLVASGVLFLATWVLVQDLGVVGGVGTDPNSMIPILVLAGAGVLALRRPAPAAVPVTAEPHRRFEGVRAELYRRAGTQPSFLFRAIAGVGALGVVLLGAVPMAAASLDPVAAPILTQAVDGPVAPLDVKAPSFHLVDQYGKQVSLRTLRGKVVAVTFLDPVCTSDCPLIAQELHEAARSLGANSRRVVFAAIVANPIYRSVADTDAFDRAEGLSGWKNWLYLTGSLHSLARVWRDFGIEVAVEPGGAMVAHNEVVYVISPGGMLRDELDAEPGPVTQASKASFSGVIVTTLDKLLPAS